MDYRYPLHPSDLANDLIHELDAGSEIRAENYGRPLAEDHWEIDSQIRRELGMVERWLDRKVAHDGCAECGTEDVGRFTAYSADLCVDCIALANEDPVPGSTGVVYDDIPF